MGEAVEALTLLLQISLATPFLIAGPSKFWSPRSLSRALEALSPATLPLRYWTAAARGIGAIEIALSLGLVLMWPWASWTGVIFGLAIAGVSARAITGRYSVTCGCFGSTHGRPIGWRNSMAGVGITTASAILAMTSVDSALPLAELERLLIVLLASLCITSVGAARDFVPILLQSTGGGRHEAA